MTTVAMIAAGVAGAIHLGFWAAQSLAWRQPAVWRAFGVKDQQAADAMAAFVFNQGFYNAFLGFGAIAGAVLLARDHTPVLMIFVCLFMVGAALVLLATSRHMWRGSLLQGLPPLIALLALSATG